MFDFQKREVFKPRRYIWLQPKTVVQRWFRFKVFIKARAKGRAIARKRLIRSEMARKKALEYAFKTILRQTRRNEDRNFPALQTLFNIGLYLLIADRDIQTLKIDALTHADEWTRKLYSRIILLTIYEWDADKVSGKALRDALDIIDPPDELRIEAIDILRELRLIQRKVTKRFSIVRNVSIAHRDPNALLQYSAIESLRVEEVFKVAVEFYVQVERFVRILTLLMPYGSNLPSLLKQYKPLNQ